MQPPHEQGDAWIPILIILIPYYSSACGGGRIDVRQSKVRNATITGRRGPIQCHLQHGMVRPIVVLRMVRRSRVTRTVTSSTTTVTTTGAQDQVLSNAKEGGQIRRDCGRIRLGHIVWFVIIWWLALVLLGGGGGDTQTRMRR
jgi:hypothetical protein